MIILKAKVGQISLANPWIPFIKVYGDFYTYYIGNCNIQVKRGVDVIQELWEEFGTNDSNKDFEYDAKEGDTLKIVIDDNYFMKYYLNDTLKFTYDPEMEATCHHGPAKNKEITFKIKNVISILKQDIEKTKNIELVYPKCTDLEVSIT